MGFLAPWCVFVKNPGRIRLWFDCEIPFCLTVPHPAMRTGCSVSGIAPACGRGRNPAYDVGGRVCFRDYFSGFVSMDTVVRVGKLVEVFNASLIQWVVFGYVFVWGFRSGSIWGMVTFK